MERRAIAIQGTVQGVGFRPFVHRLASAHRLCGYVRNQPDGVRIEVEGDGHSLDEFLAELLTNPPALAKIDDWSCQRQSPRGDREFHIDPSDHTTGGPIIITPDAGICDACLAEIFDPAQRRHRYPFTNCTHCGPRLTIVTAAPYDRDRTTMAGFEMCADCRREYEDPADRRFHAQPIACPRCGPVLTLLDAAGHKITTADPIAAFVEAILAGKIGAMKGLGGYHLICNALNEEAIAELRRRKHRDEKPLAIMVRDVPAARLFCEIDSLSQKQLSSSRRPIVLLRKLSGLPGQIAPGNPFIGVMLPYTPLHYLLMDAIDNLPLVMTSGNRSDEPIAFDEPDAIERLSGIADVFLTHNRPIHVRCDDSVTRAIDGAESPIRRSRGYAPQPIAMPIKCPEPILAAGGQMKSTFALASGKHVIVSHHMGDLDHFEAFTAFKRDVALYEELFAMKPACIAHDLHPDYASTRYANLRAGQDSQIKRVPVQHHHAHMASCMAEHGLSGPVIGITLDGTGFGTDSAIWGGEFLVGDYRAFTRAAHLRYVGLPGGEQAVREPWRMAASQLFDADVQCAAFKNRVAPQSLRIMRTMLDRKINTPMTSSAGRLFDAVAALIGLRDRVSFEGQAAMELEWLATGQSPAGVYPFALGGPAADAVPMVIDTRPLIRAIVKDLQDQCPPAVIARKFHSTLIEIMSAICANIAQSTNIWDVVFSGGVFMNALLASEANTRLTNEGFRVYRHRLVPPNDGGLSLGQVAIAAAAAVDLL